MKVVQLVTRPMYNSDSQVFALCDDGAIFRMKYTDVKTTIWVPVSNPVTEVVSDKKKPAQHGDFAGLYNPGTK